MVGTVSSITPLIGKRDSGVVTVQDVVRPDIDALFHACSVLPVVVVLVPEVDLELTRHRAYTHFPRQEISQEIESTLALTGSHANARMPNKVQDAQQP